MKITGIMVVRRNVFKWARLFQKNYESIMYKDKREKQSLLQNIRGTNATPFVLLSHCPSFQIVKI